MLRASLRLARRRAVERLESTLLGLTLELGRNAQLLRTLLLWLGLTKESCGWSGLELRSSVVKLRGRSASECGEGTALLGRRGASLGLR